MAGAASEELTTQKAARVTAGLFMACGGVSAVVLPFTPLVEADDLALVIVVALAAVVVGGVMWVLPWSRWPMSALLWSMPAALLLISGFNAIADEPYLNDLFFVLAFVWLGALHPPGLSVRFAPALVVAYVAPALVAEQPTELAASGLLVIPLCVLVGEAVAWVSSKRVAAEAARRQTDARFTAVIREASECLLVCGPDSRITFASPATGRLVGVDPDDLAGQAALAFVHPDDRAQVIEHHRAGHGPRVGKRSVEFRVRTGDGGWRWLAGVITDLTDDPDVAGIVMNAHDVTDRHLVEEQLEAIAYTDSLTGLPNRTGFLRHLERQLVSAEADAVALLFLDLDGFKDVNDSMGHSLGDCLLAEVASRLAPAIRSSELLARIGGDEFVVVVDLAPDPDDLEVLALRLAEALRPPFHLGGRELSISTSIGIAVSSAEDDATSLYMKADLALYRAKALGKARHELFTDELAREARHRVDLEAELRQALDRDELSLRYQPEIEVETGAIVAVEALVRWEHPARGIVMPGEFIPLAEATGLIVPIGTWVLQAAVQQAAAWCRQGGACAPTVSVNVSAHQLREAGFVDCVLGVLRAHELPADKLRLELTESVLLDLEATTGLLDQLRAAGVRIAIDDLGTGYSSLGYLHRLPIDALKIDRSFLDESAAMQGRLPVVEAVIAMGHSLDLTVVAEGVETSAQYHLLRQLGCDRVQGFLLGRPQMAADLEQALALEPPATAILQ